MFRKITIFFISICLLLLSACTVSQTSNNNKSSSATEYDNSETETSRSEDIFVDDHVSKIETAVSGAVENWETIISVSLEQSVLKIVVKLADDYPENIEILHMALLRTSSITDSILDYPDLDEAWDTIIIEFVDIGSASFNKSDIVEDVLYEDVVIRYFDVDDNAFS